MEAGEFLGGGFTNIRNAESVNPAMEGLTVPRAIETMEEELCFFLTEAPRFRLLTGLQLRRVKEEVGKRVEMDFGGIEKVDR